MEEKYTISVRLGDDPCTGVALAHCPVAPRCHQARRKGLFRTQVNLNAYGDINT